MYGADRLLAALVGGHRPEPPAGDTLDQLRSRAAYHGLSAFVAARATTGDVAIPAEPLAGIIADARRARRHRAILDLELLRVADAAPAQAATAIVLKGPAVALRYPDPALRPYADVDLLVPESELDPWGAALVRLGFRGPDADQARAARLLHHHLVYYRDAIPVELHWRLFAAREARALDHAALAAESAPDARMGGLLVPSLAAQLVVLGVHLAHHSLDDRKLMWLLDLITLGEADAVERARSQADRWGVGWALEAALHDAQILLGEERWGARPERLRGLAAARRSGAGPVRGRMAKWRAVGLGRSVRHAAGRAWARRRKNRTG